MASVLIIDDNQAKSAFLKISLVRQRHRVRRSKDIREAIFPRGGEAPDLVLINQATGNSTGWELFNYLKQLAPNLPVLVFVLESTCLYSAGWICAAVEAACEETDASPRPPAASRAGHPPATRNRRVKEKNRFQWK